MQTIPKNTLCLWFDAEAEAAVRFYAATFPDSSVDAVWRAPGDFPGGKAGDVLTVRFIVLGLPCIGLNGGPVFPHTEAFSLTADGVQMRAEFDPENEFPVEYQQAGWQAILDSFARYVASQARS